MFLHRFTGELLNLRLKAEKKAGIKLNKFGNSKWDELLLQ